MPRIKGIDIASLSAQWEALKQVGKDDPEGLREKKKIEAQLRKVDHAQLHPDEPMVEIEVPLHSTSSAHKPVYFHLGNAASRRIYHGKCVVPRCVAHQLLAMVAQDRSVDQRRMTAHDVRVQETGRISDIARQIAAS